jgi:hypothetical protein
LTALNADITGADNFESQERLEGREPWAEDETRECAGIDDEMADDETALREGMLSLRLVVNREEGGGVTIISTSAT